MSPAGKDRARKPRLPAWLTRQVLGLALVSLFTDMGMEMGLPWLPSLLASLGGGALALGLIDGLADCVAALLQVFSGRWADRRGRRPLLVLGHSLSALVRPLFGLAAGPWQVVAVRAADRVGKGLRKPSQSSLLEGAAEPGTRGRVFGFNDALDNAGQMLGPLLGVGLYFLFAGNLRRVLLWALAPGVLTILAVLVLVREEGGPPAGGKAPSLSLAPPRQILPALLPVAVFTLGNASDLFLVKRVLDIGAPVWSMALLWAGLAAVKVCSALLGGRLADRLGPRSAISLGWIWYALIYALFAAVADLKFLCPLFLAYGLFHGLSEGPQKALIGSLAPAGGKAGSYGWLGLCTGVLALPAGILFGALWSWRGAPAAFGAGSALALCALGLLWILPRVMLGRRA